jgi:hypothetical protein
MLVSSHRSLSLTAQAPSALPRLVERVVGDLLEIAILSIEALRDRLGKTSLSR